MPFKKAFLCQKLYIFWKVLTNLKQTSNLFLGSVEVLFQAKSSS